ncbi:MAG: hypothetical protein VKK42_22825 [Lyngbya sp.]|nr:hypothetical protein [Lyngbya sp.]
MSELPEPEKITKGRVRRRFEHQLILLAIAGLESRLRSEIHTLT